MTRSPKRARDGKRRPARARRTPPSRPRSARSAPVDLAELDRQELESLRADVQALARTAPPRWNANPDDVKRSVLKLVLTLVELIRQLLERQAIRRMEAGTLTSDQTEAVGMALMRLEETIRDLARQFDIDPSELNLDLGPIGRLM